MRRFLLCCSGRRRHVYSVRYDMTFWTAGSQESGIHPSLSTASIAIVELKSRFGIQLKF
jgi:hypothetical protein